MDVCLSLLWGPELSAKAIYKYFKLKITFFVGCLGFICCVFLSKQQQHRRLMAKRYANTKWQRRLVLEDRTPTNLQVQKRFMYIQAPTPAFVHNTQKIPKRVADWKVRALRTHLGLIWLDVLLISLVSTHAESLWLCGFATFWLGEQNLKKIRSPYSMDYIYRALTGIISLA